MEKIASGARAEAKVLKDMQDTLSRIRHLSAGDVTGVDEGSERLREIRFSVYEDLNQIQHEYLILRALKWLHENGLGSEVDWEWNPRQTGGANEPDLRGSLDGRIVLSAEASASESPKGTVDQRMRETLEKLSRMEGRRYYFVGTDGMATRARTKVAKAHWAIEIVRV